MIRIGLSDGTILNINENVNTPPSKRQIRDKSGRAGRRAWNSRRQAAAVGGYADDRQAIYAPADKELCVVVTNSNRKYTDSPGSNVRSAGGKATS